MITITNIANDEFECEKLEFIGPTMAYSPDQELVINHQSVYSDKLLTSVLTAKQEAAALAELLTGKNVSICLNCNYMWGEHADTFEDLAEFDYEDWFLEGIIVEVRPGQLKVQTGEDESEWIPFKHIDTIETAEAVGEPFEYAEMEEVA